MLIMKRKILAVTLVFISFSFSLAAQVELTHLKSKGFSATGFGAFLNITIPVTEYGYVTPEAALYYFKNKGKGMVIVPLLVGYRHMLQEPDAGFYIEPNVGYNIGGSDIQKYDEAGNPLYEPNGETLEQQVKGFTAGMSTGYILPGNLPLNIGLRYQRVFVSGDPQLNIFSLRLSYPLFRRNN